MFGRRSTTGTVTGIGTVMMFIILAYVLVAWLNYEVSLE